MIVGQPYHRSRENDTGSPTATPPSRRRETRSLPCPSSDRTGRRLNRCRSRAGSGLICVAKQNKKKKIKNPYTIIICRRRTTTRETGVAHNCFFASGKWTETISGGVVRVPAVFARRSLKQRTDRASRVWKTPRKTRRRRKKQKKRLLDICIC